MALSSFIASNPILLSLWTLVCKYFATSTCIVSRLSVWWFRSHFLFSSWSPIGRKLVSSWVSPAQEAGRKEYVCVGLASLTVPFPKLPLCVWLWSHFHVCGDRVGRLDSRCNNVAWGTLWWFGHSWGQIPPRWCWIQLIRHTSCSLSRSSIPFEGMETSWTTVSENGWLRLRYSFGMH